MATKKTAAAFVLPDALLQAYATNNRINLYLIRNLPDDAWRANPPAAKGRDIAAIVAHIHNVRLLWLKAGGAADLPPKLDPETATKQQCVEALEVSWKALEEILRQSLAGDGRIKSFKPDAAGFFAYLIAHDAHHRGQITLLARLAGHPVPQSVNFGLWEWGTR